MTVESSVHFTYIVMLTITGQFFWQFLKEAQDVYLHSNVDRSHEFPDSSCSLLSQILLDLHLYRVPGQEEHRYSFGEDILNHFKDTYMEVIPCYSLQLTYSCALIYGFL